MKKIFHDSITALVLLMFTSTLNVKFNIFFFLKYYFSLWYKTISHLLPLTVQKLPERVDY